MFELNKSHKNKSINYASQYFNLSLIFYYFLRISDLKLQIVNDITDKENNYIIINEDELKLVINKFKT